MKAILLLMVAFCVCTAVQAQAGIEITQKLLQPAPPSTNMLIILFGSEPLTDPCFAECGLDLSTEVSAFRDTLLEMVETERIYCSSYPIHLFPCLFCECQGDWEFVKEEEDSADPSSQNLYQCVPKTHTLSSRDTPSPSREPGLFGNLRKNVEKFLNRTSAESLSVSDSTEMFKTQDVDVDLELIGGPNSIEVRQGINVDDDITESGDGYELKVDVDAGVGYGAQLSNNEGVLRAAIVAGGRAEQDSRFTVGPGA